MTQITVTDLNNAKLDVDTIANIANSTSTSVTDRLGNTRRTLYSLANEFPNASDNAAATAADRVQTGLDVIATTSARDAALIQAGVYTTEAAGRAAVADGQAFKVQGSGDVAAYEYRRTNSTTSVLIATYPSVGVVWAIDSLKRNASIGKNRFNPTDRNVVAGYAINNTTGATVVTAGFNATGYIPVAASTAYTMSVGRNYAWYDSGRNYISGGTGTGVAQSVTSPVNAAYFRCGISDATLSTFQFELGTSSTSFAAYTEEPALQPDVVTTSALRRLSVTPARASFISAGKNKFDLSAVTVGQYITAAGVFSANATYDTSDYIEVVAGTAYKSSHNIRFSCYFDAAMNVVAGGLAANATTFTVPSGVTFVRVSMYHADLAAFQLEIGTTATAYESFRWVNKLTSPVADGSINSTALAASAVTPSKTDFLQLGKNKFNKATVTIGYYVTNANVTAANATYDTSDYIKVVAGTAYKSSHNIRFSCYFDANYAVVAGGTAADITTFTPPSGAAYIRVTMWHSDLDLFQLEIGATATTYEQYQYEMSLDSGVPIAVTATITPPILVMPPYIFGVQSRECNVYIDNLHVGDSSVFNHDVTNTIVNGGQQRERWTWTPTGAQTTGTLTVSAYDKTTGAALVSATTNQRAAASTAGSGTTKVINTIGDSLINAATITQTVIDIAATDVMGVSFIGTRGTAPNKHEGRGGWSINDYSTVGRTFYSFTVSGVVTSPLINSTEYTNNGSTFRVQELALVAGSGTIICERTAGTNAPSASGTLTKSSGTGDATISFSASGTVSGNPFWIGGALNYPQYLTNNSLATPDWVVIHLGINDAFGYTTDATVVAAAIAAFVNLDLLITSIKAAGAGVKVALMIPTPPASQDGFAASYGTGQTAWRNKRNIMLWAKELITKYTGQEASRIYLVPSNTALDVVNGYPLLTAAPVNSRSSITVQRQSNGVHPDTSGYQQIGDALWAFLKCNA